MPAFDEGIIGDKENRIWPYTRRYDALNLHYGPNTSRVRREIKESAINSELKCESYVQSDTLKKPIGRSDARYHTLELRMRFCSELMKAILLLSVTIVVFLRIIAQEVNTWVELWERKRELQDHFKREKIRIRTTRITRIKNTLKAQKLKTRLNRTKRRQREYLQTMSGSTDSTRGSGAFSHGADNHGFGYVPPVVTPTVPAAPPTISYLRMPRPGDDPQIVDRSWIDPGIDPG
jgi:hypothetical protein